MYIKSHFVKYRGMGEPVGHHTIGRCSRPRAGPSYALDMASVMPRGPWKGFNLFFKTPKKNSFLKNQKKKKNTFRSKKTL